MLPSGSPGGYNLNPLQQPLLYTGHPEMRPTPFNNVASPPPPLSSLPPPPPSAGLSSPTLSYQPGGLTALSWNESELSSYASGSEKRPAQQSGGPRFVQEEDAGTLSPPEENVVRLPPDYKEAWSQDYR